MTSAQAHVWKGLEGAAHDFPSVRWLVHVRNGMLRVSLSFASGGRSYRRGHWFCLRGIEIDPKAMASSIHDLAWSAVNAAHLDVRGALP